jgi:tripartite-type tricarboxylate transporter receptor subunit TctC
MTRRFHHCLLAAVLATGSAAHAQSTWPAKPVRLLVANSAGSAPDSIARVTADMLGRATGQSWIVDNRAGGEGIIAAEAAAKAAPDGYTFFFATVTTIAVTPHLRKSLPYDPLKDFTPVAMVVDSGPCAIAVHTDVPVKSLPELIALSKASPAKLSYSVTVAFLGAAGSWLTNATRMDMVPVAYKDTPQAIQDAMAGRVPVMLNALATVEQVVRSGKMRMIAVTSANRVPSWPDVPTVAETVPGYEANGWLSLAARAGAHADIVNRVNREMNAIVRNGEYRQRLEKLSWFNLEGASSPQSMSEFYRSEFTKWGTILREAGVKPQ